MLQVYRLFLVLFPFLLLHCDKDPDTLSLHLKSNGTISSDTLVVTELESEKLLGEIPLPIEEDYDLIIEGDRPIVLSIQAVGNGLSTMMILEPGVPKTLTISEERFQGLGTADSLFNDLYRTTNAFIGIQQTNMFAAERKEELVEPWIRFRDNRQETIDSLRSKMSATEYELNTLWNQERIFNFLIYMGRMQFYLKPKHPYFEFINEIDPTHPFAYTKAINILYKYELQELIKHDSIASLPDFIETIEEKTPDPDLASYLKAFYLKQLIESPFYWEPHFRLFDAEALDLIMKQEAGNPYEELYLAPAAQYFATEGGKVAPNFAAINEFGDTIRLSDWIGKVVFIDTWNTYCGPCLAARPNILEMARKYKGQSVVFALISNDRKRERWKTYIDKSNPDRVGMELHMPGDLSSDYSDKYNLTFVPHYVLIDQEGKVVSPYLKVPYEEIKQLIDQLLKEKS